MRLAVSRAVAIETSRGWRIAKEKQSHKIDVVVALAMAALAAVTGGGVPRYGMLDNHVLDLDENGRSTLGYFERYALHMMQQRRPW